MPGVIDGAHSYIVVYPEVKYYLHDHYLMIESQIKNTMDDDYVRFMQNNLEDLEIINILKKTIKEYGEVTNLIVNNLVEIPVLKKLGDNSLKLSKHK